MVEQSDVQVNQADELIPWDDEDENSQDQNINLEELYRVIPERKVERIPFVNKTGIALEIMGEINKRGEPFRSAIISEIEKGYDDDYLLSMCRELAIKSFQLAILGSQKHILLFIKKVEGEKDEPMYELTIGGYLPWEDKPITLSLGEFASFELFSRKIFGALGFWLFSEEHWDDRQRTLVQEICAQHGIKVRKIDRESTIKKDWHSIVERLVNDVEYFTTEVCPDEMTEDAYIIRRIIEWAERAPTTDDIEDIKRHGYVVNKKKGIYFYADAAKEMLNMRFRLNINSRRLWKILNDRGITTGSVRVGKKIATLWLIPIELLSVVRQEECHLSENDIETVTSSEKNLVKVTASMSPL